MKKRPTSLVGGERPGGSCRQDFKIQVMQAVVKPQLGPVGIHQGLDDADDGGNKNG